MELARAAVPGWSGRPGPRPIPAAVAQPVVDLVTGPLRPATVLAVHSAAVILTCDVGPTTRVLTVLAVEGSGVPNGVRIGVRATDRPFAHLAPGDAAFVGAGGIRLIGMSIRGVRAVRTAVPLLRPAAGAVAAVAAAAAAARRGVADGPVTALRDALAAGLPSALRSAVIGLVGLGSGSTPGGDDVLCGTLAGLFATGRAVLATQVSVAALHEVAARTPLLSADLLRLAAQGHACAEVQAVLHAVARHRDWGPAAEPVTDWAGTSAARRAQLSHAVQRLLAVGHTSGADLATGLALGLAAPAQPPPTVPRRSHPVPAPL